MIFLLGGPPRVGKSIISEEMRVKYAVSVVSTDALGAALERVLSPETDPDLFVFSRFNELTEAQRLEILLDDPDAHINFVKRESLVVWRAVEAYLRKENEVGRDVLVEGTAVLPELVGRLGDIPHRAVFIGNQGEGHAENIRKSAAENAHDWMRDASDQYVSAYAKFVMRMSGCIEQETRKYGFKYIEMDGRSFGDAAVEVINALGLDDR